MSDDTDLGVENRITTLDLAVENKTITLDFEDQFDLGVDVKVPNSVKNGAAKFANFFPYFDPQRWISKVVQDCTD